MVEFYRTYEETKKEFYNLYVSLKDKYNISLNTYPIVEDLTLDIIEFIPERKEKLLCIMTGLHGIEGYVGDFLLREFVDKQLLDVDFKTTHVVMVHSINPYGMKYKRKVNENNVDLNRNFITDLTDRPHNHGYNINKKFFLPRKLSFSYTCEWIKFYIRTLKLVLSSSKKELKEATLIGQYEFENGFYYGGKKTEKSVQILVDLYNKFINYGYKKSIYIDIHTGFGPKYQMSIINSPDETRSVEQLRKMFNYPLIQNADGNDFYEINGDMINYLNTLINPDTDYATCFEFGTIGDNFTDEIKSLRMMIQENSAFHFHNNDEKIYKNIKRDFETLYMPSEIKWLEKVLLDFNQGMNGILKHYNYI